METVTPVYPLFFLPPVQFLRKLLATPEFSFSVGERYKKQTFRNRFDILGANNRQRLSIPVMHPGNHARMAEVKLSYTEKWQEKHWRSIESAYRKSPFFEHYEDRFKPLFSRRYELLAELNLDAAQRVCSLLQVPAAASLDTAQRATLDYADEPDPTPYFQVFADRHGFVPGLSILDLIFNEGPGATHFLRGTRI